MSGAVRWAYCLVPGGTQVRVSHVEGVGGTSLRLISCGPLSMAVSDVPEDEFGEQELSRRLKDPEWTPGVALSHFAAVEALFAHGPVLPLRMCTVFRSDESAAAAVDADAATLSTALSNVEGCEQWAVTMRSSGVRAHVEPAVATSGSDYLRGIAARRTADADRLAVAERTAAELHDRLAEIAVAVEPADPDQDALRSGAYLVERVCTDQFFEAVREAEHGPDRLAVEIRGPWAPYSFVPRLGRSA